MTGTAGNGSRSRGDSLIDTSVRVEGQFRPDHTLRSADLDVRVVADSPHDHAPRAQRR